MVTKQQQLEWLAHKYKTWPEQGATSLGLSVAEVERLREFERDAMRYRWLMQNTKFGIGRNGKDWDLQVDGSAPDSISEVGEWIDNRMGGMM